jgi:hypothetical protein
MEDIHVVRRAFQSHIPAWSLWALLLHLCSGELPQCRCSNIPFQAANACFSALPTDAFRFRLSKSRLKTFLQAFCCLPELPSFPKVHRTRRLSENVLKMSFPRRRIGVNLRNHSMKPMNYIVPSRHSGRVSAGIQKNSLDTGLRRYDDKWLVAAISHQFSFITP